ncbi:hypothetical protein C8035_v009520 [Colletotrichum spinosum]|uniref:Ecp2 effector protein-like domain-containing protein n=1 Tax=Colletotrichum spinosum TaxID=1347390 RepID=A0A4R8Q0W3_9PEZI|nr:hypothetical protein C8035_v009520 [Colletotrichum spinosum]
MMIKRNTLLLLPLLAHVSHAIPPPIVPCPFLNSTNSITNSTFRPPTRPSNLAALSLGFQDPKLSGFQPDVARDDCDASGGSCHFKTKQMFRTICGESTYVNSTVSTTSPLGFKDNNTLHYMKTYGTCNFGIRPETMGDVGDLHAKWYLGTRDMDWALDYAINNFAKDGRVVANGLMRCEFNWGHR